MPLILSLMRQRQVDLSESEASLVYLVRPFLRSKKFLGQKSCPCGQICPALLGLHLSTQLVERPSPPTVP